MRLEQALELGRLDGCAQADLVRRGEASGTELIEAAIQRIEALDGQLNSISYKAFEGGLERSKGPLGEGPLAGVPYLLKDSLDYPGMPSRCGSRARAEAGPSEAEFAFTRALDAAGLIPLGKTNVPEFSLLPSTEGQLFGRARNPWDINRSTGGSSGGAAAAVAAGLVPLAHAADGGGSIRIPASCCGVVGMKPSRGGNLRARAHNFIEDVLVNDSLLGRSVRDVRAGFQIGAPENGPRTAPRSSSLRLAVVTENLWGISPTDEVANCLSRTANLCADLGHDVIQASYPFPGPPVLQAFRVLWSYLAREVVEQIMAKNPGRAPDDLLEAWTLGLYDYSLGLGPGHVEMAIRTVAQTAVASEHLFAKYDVLLTPVVSGPPPHLGWLSPDLPFDELDHRFFDYVAFTPMQNLAGLPSISLPLFTGTDDLPIGSMFTAALGAEELLLNLASELEKAQPWSDRWPKNTGVSEARSRVKT